MSVSSWKYGWQLLSVFLVYFSSGWLGIAFAGMGEGSLTLIWLPSGVGLCACLLFGTRIWPAIFLGSFCANTPYLLDLQSQWPWLKAIVFGAGAASINTLVQALFAHRLYQRHVAAVHFSTKHGVLEFIFRVAMIPSLINVALLSTLYYIGGYLGANLDDSIGSIFNTWLSGALGDFHGYFIVAPLIISGILGSKKLGFVKQDIGFILLCLSAFLALVIASILWMPQTIYILAALGVVFTMRFGSIGAAVFMFFLSLTLTLATAQQIGPFVYATDWISFVTLLVFIFGIGVPVHLLAAEGNERSFAINSLEEKVRVRTQELASAKEVAEEANKDKSRFLASASHDLRQPLHALNLQLEKLKQLSQRHSSTADFSAVDESVASLNILFNEILDVSKLDSGGLSARLTSFSVESLFTALFRDYSHVAETKGLILEFSDNSCMVQADFILLLRLLQNLLSNAIRYTNSGSIKLSCVEKNGVQCIAVEDSGIGIHEDELDNIFKEFYQVANKEREREQGVGMGLSIVKRIAQLLGYSIVIESSLGQGSRFSFKVPIGVEPEEELHTLKPLAEFDIRGAAILILDNDPQILKASEELLREWGCAVIAVSKHQEIFNKIEMEEIDLMLFDYRISGDANGVEVASTVNKALDYPVPVIISTGDISKEVFEEIGRAGFIFMQKPVAPDSLKKVLENTLSNSSVK